MNPAVVIPICITIVGISVGVIIVIHFKQTQSARGRLRVGGEAGKGKDCADGPELSSDADYASAEEPDIQLLAQRKSKGAYMIQ